MCERLLDEWALCSLLQRKLRPQLIVYADFVPELQLRQRSLYLVPGATVGNHPLGRSRIHRFGSGYYCGLFLPQKTKPWARESWQPSLQAVNRYAVAFRYRENVFNISNHSSPLLIQYFQNHSASNKNVDSSMRYLSPAAKTLVFYFHGKVKHAYLKTKFGDFLRYI